jgi:c-di-GMP-binding flagellar brake protein YcgR
MNKMRETEDLRSATRFPIKLPVHVAAEAAEKFSAETKDISAGGIMFYVKGPMEVGSQIDFTISLPAAVLGTPNDVTVQCVGRIVRCDEDGPRRAVAAVIDEYRFERA